MSGPQREVRAPRGAQISARSWLTEAPLRTLFEREAGAPDISAIQSLIESGAFHRFVPEPLFARGG